MRKSFIVFGTIVCLVCAMYLFGFRVSYVSTGSMEPTIKTGSLVVSKPVAEDHLNVGDVAVFERDNATVPIMHRVIEKSDKGIVTQGDANNYNDGETAWENVDGKVILHIPQLGKVIMIFQTGLGKTVSTVLIIGLVLYALVPSRKEEKWTSG